MASEAFPALLAADVAALLARYQVAVHGTVTETHECHAKLMKLLEACSAEGLAGVRQQHAALIEAMAEAPRPALIVRRIRTEPLPIPAWAQQVMVQDLAALLARFNVGSRMWQVTGTITETPKCRQRLLDQLQTCSSSDDTAIDDSSEGLSGIQKQFSHLVDAMIASAVRPNKKRKFSG